MNVRHYMFLVLLVCPLLPLFAVEKDDTIAVKTISDAEWSTPHYYLIITVDSLKEGFKDFALGKAMKGYSVKMKTVEEIDSMYSQYADSAERIKRYLNDFYRALPFRSKVYVLLGGSTDIIPTRFCMSKYEPGKNGEEAPSIDNLISSDLYFSALGDSLNWNANGNGYYAELREEFNFAMQTVHINSDHASLSPSFILSRIPVRNIRDLKAYMAKLFRYEHGCIDVDGFYDKMLFAGAKAYYYKNGKSDSNHIGDSIMDYIIHARRPDIIVDKLYDTSSSFDGKSFRVDDLNEVLYGTNAGYNLMNVFSHGIPSAWPMEDDSLYDSEMSWQQEGTGAAIIISSSCRTGNYANPASLALSFILNPNNNTVAYWGSSSSGWVNEQDGEHGASYRFVERFFDHLMNDDDLSFGQLIQQTREDIEFDSNKYSRERFCHLALNLLGDAEMKVYRSTPQKFAPFDILINGGEAILDTFYNDARYTLVYRETGDGLLDYSNINPETNFTETEFLYEGPFVIGLNHEDYAPFRTDLDGYRRVMIQGTELTDDSYRASEVMMGSSLDSDHNTGTNSIAPGRHASFDIENKFTISDSFTCPVGATLNINTIK